MKKIDSIALSMFLLTTLLCSSAVFAAEKPNDKDLVSVITEYKMEIVAGNATKGFHNSALHLSAFNAPRGFFIKDNMIFLADSNNNLIRQISRNSVYTYAGIIKGYDEYDNALDGFINGNKKTSVFANPTSITLSNDGFLVCDSDNNSIRKIYENNVSTFVGSEKGGMADGKGTNATFNKPQGICSDGKGNTFVADTENNAIRMIDKNANVTTIAGQKGKSGYADGDAATALFNLPTAVFFKNNVLYVADSGNNCIRAVSDGKVSTFAGASNGVFDDFGNNLGAYQDGACNRAYFNNPTGICIDDDGTMYVADTGNGVIRIIKDGAVSTLSGFAQDYGSGKQEYFVSPTGLFISNGALYVSDSFKNTIVKIEAVEND